MKTREFLEHFNFTFETEEKELILEFFICFSRFEYALKACNYINGAERITPNWDMYVKTIAKTFDQTKTPELVNAVDYLIKNPPKVQSLNRNKIIWVDRVVDENAPLVNKLRLHISDIRNNLFHGGKFNGTFSPENSRNYMLLQSAIIILNDWLEISPDIYNNFSQPIA